MGNKTTGTETEQGRESKNLYDQLIDKRTTPDNKVPEPEHLSPSLTRYDYDKVLSDATDYFEGDSLAASVWVNKYALKDSDGNLYERTPDDMHRRIAREIHRIEQKYPDPLNEETIFMLLKDFR